MSLSYAFKWFGMDSYLLYMLATKVLNSLLKDSFTKSFASRKLVQPDAHLGVSERTYPSNCSLPIMTCVYSASMQLNWQLLFGGAFFNRIDNSGFALCLLQRLRHFESF